MIRIDTDLFGVPISTPVVVRKDDGGRKIGYAARPGTGPRKQRCNTCSHCQSVTSGGIRSFKCDLMVGMWSTDPVTGIKPGAPACSEWERKPFVARKES